jgi:hypothetical protein
VANQEFIIFWKLSAHNKNYYKTKAKQKVEKNIDFSNFLRIRILQKQNASDPKVFCSAARKNELIKRSFLFSLEVFSSKIENENIKTFRKHLD